MREIFAKKRKKDRKLKIFWRILEPTKYVDLMVSKTISNFYKSASKLKKEELIGTLRQQEDGFVYVKLNNNIIHGFFPLIKDEGIEKPPYFGDGEIGAHISVITKDEIKENNIEEIKEIGQDIPFSIKGVFSTRPQGWEKMDRVWFVSIECPEVVKIRNKYGLPDTYEDKGHDYHITIAVRKK